MNVIGSLGLYVGEINSRNAVVDPIFDDSIRNINARLFVNRLDGWGGSNTFEITFTQGLTIWGGSKEGDANLSRAGADSKYRRLNVEATKWLPLGRQFGLRAGAMLQTSFGENLLASEEVGLGGRNYGHAFDPSEITGDSGLAGVAELQWTPPLKTPYLRNTQLYTFYEAGLVSQASVLPGQDRQEDIMSAGAGLRAGLASTPLSFDVYVAKPIERDVDATGNRHVRFFFSITTAL
jgi:hemolysin activation/secretion protein